MKSKITEFSALNRTSVYVALSCLSVGCILFVLINIFPDDIMLGTGVLFMVLAITFHLLLLVAVLVQLIISARYKESLFTIYCLLINFPISLGLLMLLNL